MKTISATLLFTAALALVPACAFASPVGVDGLYGAEWAGITPVSIAGGSSANGNFGSPGSNGAVAYNIYTRDDGNYFYVLLDSTDPAAGSAMFANLYFDTIASTPNTGSTLGFEIENNDAFIPGGATTLLGNSGYLTSATSTAGGVYGIEAAISNSFFLNDPLGMGFAKTPNGALVSLHLSQSFGYAVVGGSGNFAAPVELGDATVSSAAPAVPEPSSLTLLGTGFLGMVGFLRKKIVS